MKTSVTELPFNHHLGLEQSPDPARMLHLPAAGKYLNHLGTVHASALLALAEASSGEFLLRHYRKGFLDEEMSVIPVVRRLEAKFRKPAYGAVSSVVDAAPEALACLEGDLAAKGRTLISVSVEVYDESGVHALTATVDWFLQRVSPGAVAPVGV